MQPVDRLHALDAVRAYALLLGVVLHAAAAFLEGFPVPLWVDQPSPTAAVIYYIIHMFRMSAFFLIAGFFARMVVERRGVRAFVKDRAKRIGIPLACFPVIAIITAIGLVAGSLVHGQAFLMELQAEQATTAAAAAEAGESGGFEINLSHLWFLYYLLIFYALTLVLRSLVLAVDRSGVLQRAGDRVVAFLMRGFHGPLLISLPIALYYLGIDDWFEWIGLPAPFSIVPSLPAIVGYGVPFIFGWLLHRQMHLLFDLKKVWFIFLAAAIVLTIVCLGMVGIEHSVWEGPLLAGSERIIYTVAYMTGLWCWIFAFVGAAVRFLSDESPTTRYLADASYWIYLMHMATLAFFLMIVRPFDWPWGIKMAIAVGGSMPILLWSYHYMVRFTWIGAILNGRRHPRPDKSPPPNQASATS